MKKSIFILTLFIVGLSSLNHSGGTDRYGCHYDRKTGIYHCH